MIERSTLGTSPAYGRKAQGKGQEGSDMPPATNRHVGQRGEWHWRGLSLSFAVGGEMRLRYRAEGWERVRHPGKGEREQSILYTA